MGLNLNQMIFWKNDLVKDISRLAYYGSKHRFKNEIQKLEIVSKRIHIFPEKFLLC